MSDMSQLQCFLTSVIIYFMANLRHDAGAFFIFYLYTFLSAYNLTALYRMLSAVSPTFNEAIRFSVLALNVILVFVGYVIHRPQSELTIPLITEHMLIHNYSELDEIFKLH
jgi:ATP-binding cassette, subfamily G (WHITE), member 2, SNQ2